MLKDQLGARIRQSKRRASNLLKRSSTRIKDWLLPTLVNEQSETVQLARIVPGGIQFKLTDHDQTAVKLFCEHRFDLLGSGWLQVCHGMQCRGFEGLPPLPAVPEATSAPVLTKRLNKPNQAPAERIRKLLPASYQPIDWHIDFRSGFRWNERTWYRDIEYGHKPGVDVKLPWELSRMQHLAEMAFAYSVLNDQVIKDEFRNQILDWIASNPPRHGVNWKCTMDVAIRVANWLIAYDIFRAAGANFDNDFRTILAHSVHAHATHIANNLEWSETHAANHYLTNVCGLFFTAIYLPSSSKTNTWLQFALQEISSETERQFLLDGGHFEASTSYHCLCSEMIATCALFAQALPPETVNRAISSNTLHMKGGPGLSPHASNKLEENLRTTQTLLPQRFWNKLSLAADFAIGITREDGSIPLIGDDDSGRFMRFGGWTSTGSVSEMRHRHYNLQGYDQLPDNAAYPTLAQDTPQQWLAIAGAILNRDDTLKPQNHPTWQNAHYFAKALARKNLSIAVKRGQQESNLDRSTRSQDTSPKTITHKIQGSYSLGDPASLRNITLRKYPHFGLYIATAKGIYISIRCGNGMNDHSGVHAHEDQLSFTLCTNGLPVADDPGSYTYTASVPLRNAYRSSLAHYAPATVNRTVAKLAPPPFSPPTHSHGNLIYFNENGFQGTTTVDGGTVTRTITFLNDSIEIIDQYTLDNGWRPAFESPFKNSKTLKESKAYGWKAL